MWCRRYLRLTFFFLKTNNFSFLICIMYMRLQILLLCSSSCFYIARFSLHLRSRYWILKNNNWLSRTTFSTFWYATNPVYVNTYLVVSWYLVYEVTCEFVIRLNNHSTTCNSKVNLNVTRYYAPLRAINFASDRPCLLTERCIDTIINFWRE